MRRYCVRVPRHGKATVAPGLRNASLMRMKPLWRGIAALVGVWAIVAVAIFFTRAARPTPEKLQSYLAAHPLPSEDATGRTKIIESAAAQLNRLSFAERQKLQADGTVRTFFETLAPDERTRFLDLTLPEGFRQLMLALNGMKPEERKRIVRRALDDLQRENPDVVARIGDADVQKVISQGLSSFYEDADSTVKLDFAPVLEELQRATQNLR